MTTIGAEVLQVTLDSKIRLHLPGTLRFQLNAFREALKADLTLPNPEYHEALRLRRSTYRIPREIDLIEWDKVKEIASLPRGYWQQLLERIWASNIQYRVHDHKVRDLPGSWGSHIQLRDYQVEPVADAVKAEGGIVEAPPGAGKTQMGLEILARIGQPALWLTHTRDLADQVLDRAEQVLSIPRKEIGMLGGGRERIGDRLTIGIIPKLAAMEPDKLNELTSHFGAVLLDECHHQAANTWVKVVQAFPARYRYGVTGSLKRADGLERISHLVLGPTVAEVTDAQVKAAGGTVTPQLRVIRTEATSVAWEVYLKREEAAKDAGKSKPRLEFGPILDEVLHDDDRNRLIVETLAMESRGHCTLVLSDRVWHCEELARRLAIVDPQLRIGIIHGGLAKGIRREIIENTRAGNVDVLFAVDLAKEGLDIPRLDRLHLVAGGRNAVELKQKVGRIQRSLEGKAQPVIYDYVDFAIGVLAGQWYARRRVYRELGISA